MKSPFRLDAFGDAAPVDTKVSANRGVCLWLSPKDTGSRSQIGRDAGAENMHPRLTVHP